MPREQSDLDSALLEDLDNELNFAKSTRRQKFMPRIKLDKGHMALARLLPVEIGTNKSWYGRVAQHWVGGRSYFCRRNTSPYLGGDKNHACEICQVLEHRLLKMRDDVVAIAEKAIADPQWFAVALLFERHAPNGKPEIIKPPECWTAFELPLYRPVFEQAIQLYKQDLTSDNPRSITDFFNGSDIWITRTTRGTTLRADKPSPLTKKDDEMQEIINKIWGTIILPDITFPDAKLESELASKLEDLALIGGGGGRSSRSRSSDPGDEHDDDRRGGRRQEDEPHGRRFEESEPRGRHGEDEPRGRYEERNAPAARSEAAPPPPAARSEAAPAVSAPPAARGTPPPPPAARRTEAPPAAPVAAPTAPVTASVPPPQAEPRRASSTESAPTALPNAGREATPDEEAENLASELQDLAPPVAMPSSDAAPTPPKITPPTAGGTRLGARLAESLQKARQ